jgi:N-acetylmuramoyl-L-alanine amidase
MLAGWGESQWAWRDRQGWRGPIYGVIHGTASPGSTAQGVFNYFMGPNSGNCSHFVIGKAGEIYQCADPNWAAAANCCPSGNSPFVQYFNGVNANFGTWSIEMLKTGVNNEDTITEAQYKSVVNVAKWLCSVCHTKPQWCVDVSGGITSHSYLDPVHRPNNSCPNTFDWSRFFRDLQGVQPTPAPIVVTKYMLQQMLDTWCLFLEGVGRPTLPYDTGIAVSWKANYPKFNAGSPLGPEKKSVSWSGRSIQIQYFSGGYRCEWDNGSGVANWYDCFNQAVNV